MDITHVTYQTDADGLRAQYDVCIPADLQIAKYKKDSIPTCESDDYDSRVEAFMREYGDTLDEIERLTNHADGLDYAIAVSSGVITGLIDSFFVGEISFEEAQDWGTEKVEKFVIWVANQKGFKGNSLKDAVAYLEDKFPIAADKAINDFGGGFGHHLRDFSHHPTVIGLFFSMLTQFSGMVYGTDTAGFFKVAKLDDAGLALVGKNAPEKITFGVVNWFFHMVSDMAGASRTIGKGNYGTGLPGPIVALLKEVSALPFFKNTFEKGSKKGYKEFSVWISKLFNGTLLGNRTEDSTLNPLQFDLRTEIGLTKELGRQSVPVIVNEAIVRAFYFIRRIYQAIRTNQISQLSQLAQVDPKSVLPFRNRTIVRMLTISTGTLTAIDLADAAVRAAIDTKGAAPAFLPCFILRVNFVGIGRTTIAIGSDVVMGIRKGRMELAMASAEVAATAVSEVKTIEQTTCIQENTQKRLNEVTAELDELADIKL